MSTVRILIADDHEVVRCGVKALLGSRPGWEVVGEAANGREALEKAKELKPDVIILDITMPELSGVEATRKIVNAVPGTEVLILTMHESEKLIRRLLEAGARGYVSKSDIARSLVDAVEAVRQHNAFFTSRAATTLLDAYLSGTRRTTNNESPRSDLTPREAEVLQLLAEGKSNKEVASILGISIYTAETHRSNIMQKLGLHGMNDVVRYAIRNHMLRV